MTNEIVQTLSQQAGNPTTGSQHVYEVIKILAVLAGSLAGGYFSHRLLLFRDRKARLHTFLSFMTQLKGVVLYVWPKRDFAIDYRNTIPNIAHAAAPVLCDLGGRRGAEFNNMVNVLCGHSDAEVRTADGQKQIQEEIDAITRFFDT